MAEAVDVYRCQSAKERWEVLRNFIENRKLNVQQRQVHTFGLFKSKRMPKVAIFDDCIDESYEWMEYKSVDFPNCQVAIRQRVRAVNWDDAIGFDNTGNIRIWPSEEILSYLCIKNCKDFRGKTVCELGAGMTGLAGMMLSIASEAKEVLITDGNQDAVRNLIATQNKRGFKETLVKNRSLRWSAKEDYGEYRNYFDYVVCADCLLYEDAHENLLDMIYTVLKLEGTALVLSPRRGNAVGKFVEKGRHTFEIEQIQNYDEHVWSLYLQEKQSSPFSEAATNFPLLLKLKKK